MCCVGVGVACAYCWGIELCCGLAALSAEVVAVAWRSVCRIACTLIVSTEPCAVYICVMHTQGALQFVCTSGWQAGGGRWREKTLKLRLHQSGVMLMLGTHTHSASNCDTAEQ